MHRFGVLSCVLIALAVTGCTTIVVLSGPRTLSAGETATYVLSLDGPDAGNVTLYVASDVPASWALLFNSFSATIGGVPVTGSATVVADPYPGLLPPPGDGLQRIWIADGPFDIDPNDSAELSLEFDVTDVPDGEFVLKFWFISSGDTNDSSHTFAAVTVNREPRLFRFVRALLMPDGALEENCSAAASPDGEALVLGGFNDPILSVFDRNPLTGALDHNHVIPLGVGPTGLYDLTVAPDSNHFYGGSETQLAFFERDPTSGQVSMVQLLTEGVGGVTGLSWANGVAVSPDGLHVYVAALLDDALSVFIRDAATGELTYFTTYWNGGGIQGLDEPTAVAVSPDGANVYATGSRFDTLVVFSRHQQSGALGFHQVVEDGVGGVFGLDNPQELVVSADGGNVYAVGRDSDSVAAFSRDPGTGELSFVQAVSEGVDGTLGILSPKGVALSPDDRHLLVAGRHSLAVFLRSPATGVLSLLQADFDGEGGVTGISFPYGGPATSPDGLDVFYAGYSAMAVFSARVFADGFESGDTSAWSVLE